MSRPENFSTASGEELLEHAGVARTLAGMCAYIRDEVAREVRKECAADAVAERMQLRHQRDEWIARANEAKARAERAERDRDAWRKAAMFAEVTPTQIADAKRQGQEDGFVDGARWFANRCVDLSLFNVPYNRVPDGHVTTILGESARDAAKARYAPPAPAGVEDVTLSDGRVFEVMQWEWRKDGPSTTYDIVRNHGRGAGLESRQCFDSVDEMRQRLALPWTDWQAINAALLRLADREGKV